MKNLLISIGLVLVFVAMDRVKETPEVIIDKVLAKVGGMEAFRALKDVSYEYTFQSQSSGIKDVSMERYIFDGEYSYAYYKTREYYMLPQMEGVLTQYFDGQSTVSKINGNIISEKEPAYAGHFFRKTNFYWFNMMFKLQDPGVILKNMPKRKVNGVAYDIVEMTFEQGTGETSDRYILYVNPNTQLVDQFLFTVFGFGIKDPLIMKLKYEKIEGLYLPTYRKYAPADWEGNVIKDEWNEQISKNIKFNNGFTPDNISYLTQQIVTTEKIPLSSEKAWKIVRDFRNLPSLAPEMVKSIDVTGRKSEASWVIETIDGNTITEKTTQFDDKQRLIAYEMTETEFPLKDYKACIKIESVSKSESKIVYTINFKAQAADKKRLSESFEHFQKTYISNLK